MGSEELKDALRGLFRRRRPSPFPSPAYGEAPEERLERRLKEVERELNEVRGRINRLIFLVLTAMAERVVTTILR